MAYSNAQATSDTNKHASSDTASAAEPTPRGETTSHNATTMNNALPASEDSCRAQAASAAKPEQSTVKAVGRDAIQHLLQEPLGGGAGKPSRDPVIAIRRNALNPLLEACWWNDNTGAWETPPTEPDDRLQSMDWPNMLNLPSGWTPTRFVPTFFHDEPDPNQRDKPRLDIVVHFEENMHSVRYHPRADPIWSTSQQPTDAMRMRYNRARKLAKKNKA